MDEVETLGTEGKLLCHVGGNLPRILREEVDALQLQKENSHLNSYFSDTTLICRKYKQAAKYLDMLGHKDPHMSILELDSNAGRVMMPDMVFPGVLTPFRTFLHII